MRSPSALLIALFIASCSFAGPETLTPAQTDSLIHAQAHNRRFHLVDVRTLQEYNLGHLQGAELIDFHGTDFARRIGRIPRDAPVLLYCRSGNRSGQALQMLRDLGFTDVHHLGGGIGAWAADNRVIVQ